MRVRCVRLPPGVEADAGVDTPPVRVPPALPARRAVRAPSAGRPVRHRLRLGPGEAHVLEAPVAGARALRVGEADWECVGVAGAALHRPAQQQQQQQEEEDGPRFHD